MKSKNFLLENNIKHIVFDWNGTLLDDLLLAIDGVNKCATRFGVKPVTYDSYRESFCFPISEFYGKIGFDFSSAPISEILKCYLDYFDLRVADCCLHFGVCELLEKIRRAGIDLYVLSASNSKILEKTIFEKKISQFFTHVVGLKDNLARSKHVAAVELQKLLSGDPAQTLFIGDTLHDYDVAKYVGWKPVLLATGHQSLRRLLTTDALVLRKIHELAIFFGNPVPHDCVRK